MARPVLKSHIGQEKRLRSITGGPLHFVVEDEIIREQKIQEKNTAKLIYLQKLRFFNRWPRIQYRFCYYMIGVKPGRKGKWVFGEKALFVPPRVLFVLLREARKRKWKGF